MKERIFIKGFDKNLQCRGYQFEIGKDYKIELPEGYKLTEDDLCSNKVFHFCDGLSKVHEFYECSNEENRYCVIEVLGQFCETPENGVDGKLVVNTYEEACRRWWDGMTKANKKIIKANSIDTYYEIKGLKPQ